MVLHPVGPLPASTYWRRRLVLLVVLVAVVLLVRSCAGGGSEKAGGAASPTPTPVVTHSPTPAPTAPPAAGPVGCSDKALTLTTSTDAGQYGVGATPRITLTVKNVSAAACRRDLGSLELTVYSGPDRIWASDDCAPRAGVSVQTLGAGATLQTTKTWNGKRSARGCAGDRAQAKSGTYTVRAHVGTLVSTVSVFRIS
jgi:hypothetical protein